MNDRVLEANSRLGRTPEQLEQLLAPIREIKSRNGLGLPDYIDMMDQIFFVSLGEPWETMQVERSTLDRLTGKIFSRPNESCLREQSDEEMSQRFYRARKANPIDDVPVGTVRLVDYLGNVQEEGVLVIPEKAT